MAEGDTARAAQDAAAQQEDVKMSTSKAQAASGSEDDAAATPAAEPKKASKLKKLWEKTGLDVPTILIMIKAALPPTIATAMYQATPVARQYTTLGYLVSIMSILGFCIMPRAKFIQTMTLNLVGVSIGSAVALLSIYCTVQARLHTTPAGRPPVGYNSSAAAVSAIWLFFQVYIVNTIKSARPQFTFPCIIYAIFALVASTYAPQFPNMAAGEKFVRTLLIAFLTGFGLATGVSFVVMPVSTRTVAFKEMTGYLQSMRGVLKSQNAYLQGMENDDMFLDAELDDSKSKGRTKKNKKPRDSLTPLSTKAAAYRAALSGMLELHGKLTADLPFAKKEIAIGKLSASDIKEISAKLRNIMLPLLGLGSITDIFERIATRQGWDKLNEETDEAEMKRAKEHSAVKEWQSIMKLLHRPFQEISDVMDQAIEHVLLRLELKKPAKAKKGAEDVEDKGDEPQPGDDKFAEYLRKKTTEFSQGRQATLQAWCRERGISLEPGAFASSFDWLDLDTHMEATRHEREQSQLFCVLYMEYLLWSAGQALFVLVRFADDKHADGTMKRSRFIAPGLKQLKKWLADVFKEDDTANDDHKAMADDFGRQEISMGDAFHHRHDPEHLPPTNALEKLGNYIRMFPRFMRSPHSAFGFRAACATMSVGIIAFLHDTESFFIKQRLVWAMIMIAFSMTRTSGESAFNFLMRIFGTFVAMVASYVIYYIVDGKTAGVIVFLWLWVTACFYVVLKMPRFVVVGIITAITAVLVIGYELEVKKIGVATASSNGQPYYPIYQLAPYRLATVAGGLFVAYIWTIFPYPMTEHNHLRHDLGGALYLLANHYSIVHEIIGCRVRGDGGDPSDKNSPAFKLEKARVQVVTKTFMLIARLQSISEFTRWQVSVGGRFPKEMYDEIIKRCSRILSYSALMGYASSTFGSEHDSYCQNDAEPKAQSGGDSERQWLDDFRKLLQQSNTTSHDVTSMLSLLSNSVTNGAPLPPYLRKPEPYRLVRRLEALDRDILGINHIAEPGYAAFAVTQIASRSILADMDVLASEVKKLVGELDFSFHAVSTADGRSSDGSDSEASRVSSAAGGSNGKGKRD